MLEQGMFRNETYVLKIERCARCCEIPKEFGLEKYI